MRRLFVSKVSARRSFRLLFLCFYERSPASLFFSCRFFLFPSLGSVLDLQLHGKRKEHGVRGKNTLNVWRVDDTNHPSHTPKNSKKGGHKLYEVRWWVCRVGAPLLHFRENSRPPVSPFNSKTAKSSALKNSAVRETTTTATTS